MNQLVKKNNNLMQLLNEKRLERRRMLTKDHGIEKAETPKDMVDSRLDTSRQENVSQGTQALCYVLISNFHSYPLAPSQPSSQPPHIITDVTVSPSRKFLRRDQIGKGAFATVFAVKEVRKGLSFAVKAINKNLGVNSKKRMRQVKREIKIHRELSHVNVIQFKKTFDDSNFVYLLLELAPNNSLLQVQQVRVVLTEPEVRYYFAQIAAGIGYIHSKKILHRDIKLGNIFLSHDMTVKIGDFGLSVLFADSRNHSGICGTPNYISPEVVSGIGHSIESEIWSIGCVVYALLCGKPPFDSDSVSTTYRLIRTNDFLIPAELSLSAQQFIRQLLDSNPRDRGNLGPVTHPMSLLGHPFMTEGYTPLHLPASAVTEPPDWEGGQVSPVHTAALCEDLCEELEVKFPDQVRRSIRQFLTREDDSVRGSSKMRRVDLPVFISQWADYSNSFGFLFKLSDGNIGVRFNDGTKLGASADGKLILSGIDENENSQNIDLLKKRLNNIKYYIEYVKTKLQDTVVDNMKRISTEKTGSVPLMEKFVRTESMIVMQLSSQTIQVNFIKEHCKLVIWAGSGKDIMVAVISKKGTTTKAETFSLVSDSKTKMSASARRFLSKIEAKLEDFEVN